VIKYQHLHSKQAESCSGIFVRGGSTNSVENRGQREQGSEGSIPLVRGSVQFANEFRY
jgi:hypothetical protein